MAKGCEIHSWQLIDCDDHVIDRCDVLSKDELVERFALSSSMISFSNSKEFGKFPRPELVDGWMEASRCQVLDGPDPSRRESRCGYEAAGAAGAGGVRAEELGGA